MRKYLFKGQRKFNTAWHQLAYCKQDPWSSTGDAEQYRFREINKIIQSTFGFPNRIVELGCGEGHHSMHLRAQCKEHLGIDCSWLAIQRARKKLPQSQFVICDIEKLFESNVIITANDLVCACEVIYYLPNPVRFLQQLSHTGCKILVTRFNKGPMYAESLLREIGMKHLQNIQYNTALWQVYVNREA